MVFRTPSTRIARPHCLHSNACASDNRIKPPQVGHGTSRSVLIAVTRIALALRPDRNRVCSCRSAGMNTPSFGAGIARFDHEMEGGPAPDKYLPRWRGGECDIRHKIPLFPSP